MPKLFLVVRRIGRWAGWPKGQTCCILRHILRGPEGGRTVLLRGERLVMTQARDGHPAPVRVYAISADGREMTESAAGVHDSGAPFVRSFHFRRIR